MASPLYQGERLLLLLVVDATLILQLSISIIHGAAAENIPAMAKPNCKDRCGDVSIPYPFGIEQGCYLHEDFAVRCKNNQASVMTGGQINSDSYSNVSGINLLNGEVRIQSTVYWDCGNITDKNYVQQPQVLALPNSLKVSYTKNKFTAIGCATIANIVGNTDMGGTLDLNNLHYTSACASFCDSQNRISKSAECDGLGCCQTSIPANLSAFRLGLYYDNQLIRPYGRSFSPCSYAFVVEAIVSVIICTSALLLKCQKRKLEKEKERFFKQNGGHILYQQILSKQIDTVQIFTIEELKKATDNFDRSRELGTGGHGTVYKGILGATGKWL